MTSVIVVEHQMNLTSTKKLLSGHVNGNRKCINGYNLEVSLFKFSFQYFCTKWKPVISFFMLKLFEDIHNVYLEEKSKCIIIFKKNIKLPV